MKKSEQITAYEKAKEMFVRLMLKDIDEEAENKQFIEDVTRLCDKYKSTT